LDTPRLANYILGKIAKQTKSETTKKTNTLKNTIEKKQAILVDPARKRSMHRKRDYAKHLTQIGKIAANECYFNGFNSSDD